MTKTRWLAGCAMLLLTAAVLPLGGCQLFGWAAQGMSSGVTKTDVKAQYTGLDNKTVAVVVAADEFTLFRSPNANLMTCRAVSARISDEVPGARVVDPKQIIAFQKDNPYWTTMLPSQLIAKLGVERMVYVDLVEYETHEPGNKHVGQGKIVANVSVLEAEASGKGLDADQYAFSAAVQSLYPEEHGFGVLEADMQTIELAVVSVFSRDTVRLFHDHVKEEKK